MGLSFDAVLFDCDGVLVDSEWLTNSVLRDMLEERGWHLTLAECMDFFVGKAVRDEAVRIEQETGQPLTEDWLASFRQRRNAALLLDLKPIANVQQAVQQIHAGYKGRIACASGADRLKIELMLGKLGLLGYFRQRIFSGHEMARSKPFPDVYLAAAAALQIEAARCAVIEDTVTGVMAGVAAGATVFAYSPAGSAHVAADDLRDAGAHCIFTDMQALPGLLGCEIMPQLTFT